MSTQSKTFISEAVLAVTAFCVAYQLIYRNFFACLGLIIEGASAAAGFAERYTLNPDEKIVNYHATLKWLTLTLGLPMLGSAFAYSYGHNTWGNMLLLFSIGVVVSSRHSPSNGQRSSPGPLKSFAMSTIIMISFMHLNLYGLAMAALYSTSASIIGTQGFLFGFRRVDIMLYMLAVGNLILLKAL